jgi:hypothetical protein
MEWKVYVFFSVFLLLCPVHFKELVLDFRHENFSFPSIVAQYLQTGIHCHTV